jgi:hypothetical protein
MVDNKDAASLPGGWVMAYFTTPHEALHLALSTNGTTWRPIHDQQPLVFSTVGTRSMRDPFVFRARDGRFHLLWTDGWRSRAIGHSCSDDLITWEQQRLLPVMDAVPGAQNSWAPECFYDRECGEYRLIWSSTVEGSASGDVWNHRIWSATTPDFVHVSPPAVWFDPEYPVIDATVVHTGSRYVMIFKDERGSNRPGTDNKAMRVAVSGNGGGPFEVMTGLVTPHLTEGPAVFQVEHEWLMIFDHFLDHAYGASRSADLLHWRPTTDDCRFPPGARHASVVPVSREHLARLEHAWE